MSSALLLLAAGSAHAHSLNVECKLKGDTVVVEAYFSDNKPARDAKVTVRDSRGVELASGRTDGEGRWTFPAPAPGKYEVTCDLGDGHRSKPMIVTIPTPAALKAITPPPEEIVISGGPTREELTRFPWLRLMIGVAAIGGLAALLWVSARRRGSANEST